MKSLVKKDMGVSPVIAVILMVAITVVLAGVVFLWAQSFTEDTGDDVRNLNIKVSLYEDTDAAAADILEIEVLGGTIIWGDYEVNVESTDAGSPTSGATGGQSTAGDTAVFTSPVVITSGQTYKVQIIDLEANKVAYTSENVIAKSYDSVPGN